MMLIAVEKKHQHLHSLAFDCHFIDLYLVDYDLQQ